MGVGPVTDRIAGPDYDGEVGAMVYRMTIGEADTPRHSPSPHVTRAEWSAIIDAAEVSMAALEAHIAQEHSALWSWWQSVPTGAEQASLRAAIIAGRGL